ncbi:ribbon-helix-helix protein, CopG family [Burkholderia cenocepacia]|uniref:ribbon-helix-helix protein, CopG family n=1 Tax=Burkholderia cenocepacia TaxID=95486 RepID=UPI000981549D|nr:ribbon-helix-helix protein, CopG family [Burkholderia cenocepacia]
MKNQWKEERIIMQLHFYHEDRKLKEQIQDRSKQMGISQMEFIRIAIRTYLEILNKEKK